jgi:cytochrome P450 family 142 subfamily A polypeptide 1
VYWDPIHRIWGISRYEDIVEIEKNTRRYSSLYGSRPRADQRDDTSMINKDDPDHQRQRMLVARQFTPRAVKQLETDVRALVTALIDDVISAGACDAVQALASPLPAIVIGDKLGYPRELWPKLREWSEITMYESSQFPPDGSEPVRAPKMEAAMAGVLRG